jgi:heterotetrameric sarcosine oxidase gamma subunit
MRPDANDPSEAAASACANAGALHLGVIALPRAVAGCVLVTSSVDSGAGMDSLQVAAGCEFPLIAGSIVMAGPNRILWLTPRSWLVLCHTDMEGAIAGRINEEYPDKQVHAAEYGDALAWLELTGSDAWRALTRGGFVSLDGSAIPVGGAKRTNVAGVVVVVLRTGLDNWLLAVERSVAGFMVTWLKESMLRAAA